MTDKIDIYKYKDYLNKPYHIVCIFDGSDGEPGWVAYVEELQGCITQAVSWNELHEMLEDAMLAWIAVCIENGQPVPEPREEQLISFNIPPAPAPRPDAIPPGVPFVGRKHSRFYWWWTKHVVMPWEHFHYKLAYSLVGLATHIGGEYGIDAVDDYSNDWYKEHANG